MTVDRLLGVDVGGTKAKFVVTARNGSVISSGEVDTDPGSCRVTLDRVAGAVAGELGGGRQGDGAPPRLHGLGLACAGIVDPGTGRLGRSPNLPGWEESDLFQIMGGVFGPVACAVANDVNAALFGEYQRGAGRRCSSLIMIALGTGVGGGVLIDGRLVIGAHCGAGEIGHMVLDPEGPACTCGGRGCLEAYAGSVALLRAARRTAAGPCSPEFRDLVAARSQTLSTLDLADLAGAGNRDALDLFTMAGRRLGQAVGNLVNILDPDRVIIGGGVAQAGDLILAPCREVAPTLVLAREARALPIVAAELGPLAAALGAALLVQAKEPIG